MIITYKDFPRLKFPLFVLPSDNWFQVDGVLFLDGMVLDEKNMPGKTLGIRRLQCDRSDLVPIKKAVLDIPALLKCKEKSFIDSSGRPFLYEKTYSSKLICYKIKSVQKKETASLLWLHGVPQPFTLQRPPLNDPECARVLHIDSAPWIVYDYVRKIMQPTYRRV